MKIRVRKKQLERQRMRRSQFVKDTLRGLYEVKQGQLSPYIFSSEDIRVDEDQSLRAG